jgi:DNA-binding beta-propeller fold protein YncE
MPDLRQEKLNFLKPLSKKKEMMNRTLGIIIFALLTFSSCKETPKKWVYTETIKLEGITPIGMIAVGDDFWLSDVDHDRLVKIDARGKIIDQIDGLIRPMHIDGDDENIYIPQFGADNIVRWDGAQLNPVDIGDSLDAPGGIGVGYGMIAVADFFNHRVLVNSQEKSFIIGKEGHDNSSLYYPTDIDITAKYIYIADAYNNRVEVYDHQGSYVRTIGWQEGIKVAAGVEVGNEQIFITDFHNSRLFVYDIYGALLQTFDQHLDDPTDALLVGNKLYVMNFKGQSLSVFKLQ